jgi:hypothetical protein
MLAADGAVGSNDGGLDITQGSVDPFECLKSAYLGCNQEFRNRSA